MSPWVASDIILPTLIPIYNSLSWKTGTHFVLIYVQMMLPEVLYMHCFRYFLFFKPLAILLTILLIDLAGMLNKHALLTRLKQSKTTWISNRHRSTVHRLLSAQSIYSLVCKSLSFAVSACGNAVKCESGAYVWLLQNGRASSKQVNMWRCWNACVCT